MKKITMANFMYHLLKEVKNQTLFISHIKYAVGYVAREADIMLTDTFDSRLECVLEPIEKHPNVFEITERMNSIILKDNGKFKAEEIDKDTKNAMKACLEHIMDPMYYAGIDVDFATEKENEICSNTKIMEFFVYMIRESKAISTSSTSKLNSEGLAHLVRLPNLYNLLSRYYSKNFMEKNNGRDEESFVLSFYDKEEEVYFEVTKTTELIGKESIYKVIPVSRPREFVYFPDLALDVPNKLYYAKKAKYNQVKKVLQEAAALYIPYENVSYMLESAYGHTYDDE